MPAPTDCASTCPLCQRPNACGAGAKTGRCWCFDATVPTTLLARVPAAQRGTACICKDCITAFLEQAASGTRPLPGSPIY